MQPKPEEQSPKSRGRRAQSPAVVRPVWHAPELQGGLAFLIVVLGLWLRFSGLHDVTVRSPDEHTYAMEATLLRQHGVAGLREAAQHFQQDASLANLPRPTRAAYLWLLNITMNLTGDITSSAGVALSCAASVASLLLVWLIGWQFFSPPVALVAMLFYAVSPAERMFAQRTWQESVIECVALSLFYVAARITQGARSSRRFALFAALTCLSLGLKEVSIVWALLCVAWVLLNFVGARNWRATIIFSSWCLAGVTIGLVSLAVALGGLRPFLELTIGNMRDLSLNPYSREYEGGPPYRLVQALFVISPVAFFFALPGALLVWRRDQSERGLVKREEVTKYLGAFTVIFLLAAALIPHHMNLRYICMAFGPLYLFAGLGFCWIVLTVRDQLDGYEKRLFTGFAAATIIIGVMVDLATFRQRLSAPAVVDLSAKMLLDAADPAGPIRPMPSNGTPNEVTVAEQIEANEPSPRHLLELAISYEQAGRHEDSILTARKVLLLQPDSADAYNVISAASAAQEHWDAAIEAANDALQLNPSYQLAKNNLQWAQHEKQIALQEVSEK